MPNNCHINWMAVYVIAAYFLIPLISIILAIPLNYKFKWVTLDNLTTDWDADVNQIFFIIGILLWPISIIILPIVAIINLLLNVIKNYLPKE